MGNSHSSTYQSLKPRKNVHWKSAERPLPPGKPDINPIISEQEQNAIILKWDAPKSDGGAPLVGYQVECNRLGTTVWIRTSPPVITKAELILTGLEPGYMYQFRVSAENAVGVSEPSEYSDILNVSMDKSSVTVPKFTSGLKDVTAMENEKVEFLVSFDGAPLPTIAWFKDGYEIFSSRRTAITTDRNTSILIFHQASFNDEGEIKCTATNRAGYVITRAKFQIESVPKIRLPRQYEDGVLYEINETIFFKVSVVGKPLPMIEWRHDGQPLVSNERIEISNTDKFSVLRISNATRNDRGEYHIYASNKIGEDEASFLVTITAKPEQPGPVTAKLFNGTSVMLSWQPPMDDGGCKIGNYILEYYRTGWDVWLKAATSRKLTTVIHDLIEGSEYRFRVKAESPYGVSIPSVESSPVILPGKSLDSNAVINEIMNEVSSKSEPLITPRRKRPSTVTKHNNNQGEEKTLKPSLLLSNEKLEKYLMESNGSDSGAKKSAPGSSEFMLVLFPESEKNAAEKRKSFQLDLEDALTPPPLSLSAPDLGTTHFMPMRPLRNSVSSTELLHERAMDRFYQAMAIKEALNTKTRRDSIATKQKETPEIKIDLLSEDENEFNPLNSVAEMKTVNYVETSANAVSFIKNELHEKPTESIGTWKTVSFDEDYSASTVSTGGSDFSLNDSLHGEAERNFDFGSEQTYHPKVMKPVNKSDSVYEDEDTSSKNHVLCHPSFIPKPILKHRDIKTNNEIEDKMDEPVKTPKVERKPEKRSLFKKITKPQFPKSFSIVKKDSKNKKIKNEDMNVHQNENKPENPENAIQEPINDKQIDDIDGGQIVIEHYGNIVKEYGQSKKLPPTLYINTEQLKGAAELQNPPKSVKPKLHVKKKLSAPHENTQKPLPKKVTTPKNLPHVISKTTSNSETMPDKSKSKSSHVQQLKTESMLRAKIIIPKDYSELESEAKETIHSAIDYTIDVVMILVAFWLFVFKDERLAVPVLMITVYRQLREAISKRIPPWFYDKLKRGN